MKKLIAKIKDTVITQNTKVKTAIDEMAAQPTMHKRDLKEAANIIKEFEGLRLSSYRDSVGVPTIGWGSTKGVKMGMRITKEQAESLFDADFMDHMLPVQRLLKVMVNDNEFGALVSLCFNIGSGAFAKSTLLKRLNAGSDRMAVADQFLLWDKAGGKRLNGLTRRRRLERNLFLRPTVEVNVS